MFPIKRNQVVITSLVAMLCVAGYLNYTDNKTPKGVAMNPDLNNNVLVENSEGSIDFENTALTNKNIVEDDIGIGVTQKYNENEDKIKNLENYNNSNLDSTSSEKSSTVTEEDSKNQYNESKSTNTASNVEKEETQNSDSTEQSQADPGAAAFVSSSLDSTYFVQAKLDREQSRAKQKELLLEVINNQNLDKDVKADSAESMLNIQQRIEKESAAEAMIKSKGFSDVFVRIDDDTVDVVVNKDKLSDAELAQIEDIIKRKTGLDSESIRISTMKSK